MEGVRKNMSKLKPDFGGYATKYNVKCTDGRIILPEAFKHMDGMTVPLVWQHLHNTPANVLGHALLEDREDGVYVYGFLNDSDDAKHAKKLIQHKDIDALSIWANKLVEKSQKVAHGVIREASLVLSGANPGAKIDNIAFTHSDGSVVEDEEEAIIHSGLSIELPKELDDEEEDEIEEDLEEILEDEEVLVHADQTIGDVFNSLSETQKTAVYAIIGQLMESGEIEHSDEENPDEGDSQIMKKNVFDGSAIESEEGQPKLTHAQFNEIMNSAKELGSLKQAILKHAGTYGIDNIEYLFPDARNVTKEPTWIARRMEWVAGVLSGTKHSPFSRIKSLHADITADEARARGYVTGNLKVEEVFPILRRVTTPHTVYKKQKLDRDDIVDIVDFNVVSWLKSEMRVMLDEEIARAILVGDGRDPVAEVDDHIPTENVRPVWTDSDVYAYHQQVVSTADEDDLIDEIIRARSEYRGSGNPTMYISPGILTEMLLLKDADGRRLYKSESELASELRVKKIVEVPVMEDLVRDDDGTDYALKAIIVNLRDYTVGADKGGEINFFDDFDIDYNQYKYLIETRISGALTVPKSALIIEQEVAD
jgi:HK97 family phage prohead protease